MLIHRKTTTTTILIIFGKQNQWKFMTDTKVMTKISDSKSVASAKYDLIASNKERLS